MRQGVEPEYRARGVSGIHGSEQFTSDHLFRIARRFRSTLLDEYMNSVVGVVSCRLSAMECLDDHGCDYHHQMVILPRSMGGICKVSGELIFLHHFGHLHDIGFSVTRDN